MAPLFIRDDQLGPLLRLEPHALEGVVLDELDSADLKVILRTGLSIIITFCHPRPFSCFVYLSEMIITLHFLHKNLFRIFFFWEKSRLEIIPDFHDWLRSWSRLKWLLVRSSIVKTTSFHNFANAVVCLPSWMQILFRADQSEAADDQWEAGSLGGCVATLLCNAFCLKYWDFWSSPQVWSGLRSSQ